MLARRITQILIILLTAAVLAACGSSSPAPAASANTYLDGVILSEGSLEQAFSRGVTQYNAVVGNAVSSINITATVEDPAASVSVNGVSVVSGRVSQDILLNVGDNRITVVVTAPDATTHREYTFIVTRLSGSNALLAELSLSSGAITDFTPTIKEYSVTVDNYIDAVSVTAVPQADVLSVTVNGDAVTPGQASKSISLTMGIAKIISVVVVAEDGQNSETYNVIVTRKDQTQQVSNIDLKNLVVSVGSLNPVFSSAQQSYSITVPNNVTSTKVTPTSVDLSSTITVENSLIYSGDQTGDIPLAVGNNDINILVTGLSNETKEYIVHIYREPRTNANLSGLSISPSSLDQIFSTSLQNYTATVYYSNSSITVTPTVEDSAATVTVNNVAVSSGQASGGVSLSVGSANVINVVVTAQDGVTQKTYAISVTRLTGNNANLQMLTPSTGTFDELFAVDQTFYNMIVDNSVTQISLTATSESTKAKISIDSVDTQSGMASAPLSLAVGDNAISVVVTAEANTNSKTYIVNVMRRGDPALSAIGLSSGSVAEAISSTTLNYTASVPATVTTMTVTPTLAEAGSSVTVDGNTVASGSPSDVFNLNLGSNVITMVVTSVDGITSKTFTLDVTRENGIPDLSALSIVSQSLDQTFDAATTNYTATVGDTVSSVQIVPTVFEAGATVTVDGQAVTSGAQSQAINLTAGVNTIDVVVTSMDQVSTKTYQIDVTRLGNAKLSALSLSTASLVEVFDSATFNYTASVNNLIGSIRVNATTQQTGATISVNGGASFNSGEQSLPVALDAGVATTLNVVVTAADGTTTETYSIDVTRAAALVEQEYVKTSTAIANEQFGYSVAASGDTVVGSRINTAGDASGVFVYVRDGTNTWSEQKFWTRTGTGFGQYGNSFGKALAISGDALAIGAPAGINNTNCSYCGYLFIYERTGSTWSFADSFQAFYVFGAAVAMDGSVLAVQHPGYSVSNVRVYERTSSWTNTQTLTPELNHDPDGFGVTIAISGDTMVIGANLEDSAAVGVGGEQVSDCGAGDTNCLTDSGAAWVFRKVNGTWVEEAYLKPSNTHAGMRFGSSVDISGDTIVVGAPFEQSPGTGVNGSQDVSTPLSGAGAVYVFKRNGGGVWQQEEYIKADAHTLTSPKFGQTVALDNDTLAVGLGHQKNDGVHVYRRVGNSWEKMALVSPHNYDGTSDFIASYSFNLALDGDTLAIGAPGEDGSTQGLGGNGIGDNGVTNSGATYIFQ